MSKRINLKWTKEELKLLHDLLNLGKKHKEIAEIMNITLSRVACAVYNHNIKKTATVSEHKCYICKQKKLLEEFFKDKSHKGGYGFRCKQCNKKYKKNYHETYSKRDDVKERRRKKYQENVEAERLKNRNRRNNNPEHYKELSRKSYRKNIRSVLLTQSRQRAKRYGYEHNITVEDIIIPEYCPILGIPIFISEKQCSWNSPSLDRIDNNKGYIKNNVMVMSFRANTLKSNGTAEEFEKILEFLKRMNLGDKIEI